MGDNIPVEKWSKAELEAELDLYRRTRVQPIPFADSKELSNNEKRVALIKELRAKHGIPHEVTEQDLDPELGLVDREGVNVGDVILLPENEEKDPQEDDQGQQPGTEEKPDALAEAGRKPFVAAPEGQGIAKPAERPTVLLLDGKQVTDVQNQVLNGRIYKRVTTIDGTSTLLSPDEFVERVEKRTV